LNGGNTGNAQYVAFFGVALFNQVQGAGLHADTAACHGDSFCVGFAADINHVRLATLIKMGKCVSTVVLFAHGLFPRWFIFMMAAELAA
jgi:hypothetical protein